MTHFRCNYFITKNFTKLKIRDEHISEQNYFSFLAHFSNVLEKEANLPLFSAQDRLSKLPARKRIKDGGTFNQQIS